MFTKMILTSAVIAVIAGVMQTSGVVDLKTVPKDLGLSGNEPRYIIVGADITAGREKELSKDFEAVQGLLAKSQPGDIIEVYLIHSRAESAQGAICTVHLPSDEGPMGMALDRAKKAAVESFHESWDRNIKAIQEEKTLVQQSDLFGFFRFISQKTEFRRNKSPVLILLTDGQEVGDGFNFERSIPSGDDLKKARAAELMPDLSKVIIAIAGMTPCHGISNLHWRKLQQWWRDYVKQAGGNVVAITSDRGCLSNI